MDQLLYIQHCCQLVKDFGIVVVTVEHLSIDTLCQHCNRQACMAVGGEADAGLIVQNTEMLQ